MKQYISFNSNYILKPDKGRTLILAAQIGRSILTNMSETFETYVHPLYSMILCFIDGREKQECINSASQVLNISPEMVDKFISKLIDNSNFTRTKSKDGISTFPPFTIITNDSENIVSRYNPNLFTYTDVDLINKRHLTPTSITLMLNNVCVTDCFYCYCDKRKRVNCQISLDRILQIIRQAHKLNVRTFDVIGGEFFLYNNWKEVLRELLFYNFNPYLSTKIPLNEDTVRELADLRIQDIQISLDTLISKNLMESLGVKDDYYKQMMNTITLLDKYNIPVIIHSILSQKNKTVDDMISIYEFIKDKKNIKEWKIDQAGSSLYTRVNYKDIQINEDDVESIAIYIDKIRNDCSYIIRAPRPAVHNQDVPQNITGSFFERGFCSGNFSAMFILPDGNVTICEELYWMENFFLGNVIDDDIIDIWNSEKAKSLFYIKQKDIANDSLCHSCADFTECRSVKQVCYKEIIKKHGVEKWYYPDVSCPYITQ